MDWNQDGKHDWFDTAMDLYVMDEILNDKQEDTDKKQEDHVDLTVKYKNGKSIDNKPVTMGEAVGWIIIDVILLAVVIALFFT